MEFKQCEVGLWKLPGLVMTVDEDGPTEEEVAKMEEWANENNCGKLMTSTLWSFRNEKQRDWFILRWTESTQVN